MNKKSTKLNLNPNLKCPECGHDFENFYVQEANDKNTVKCPICQKTIIWKRIAITKIYYTSYIEENK